MSRILSRLNKSLLKANVSNFLTRTITGILFVIVVIGSIIWKQIVFSSLFLVITIAGLHEFYRIAGHNNSRLVKVLGMTAGLVLYVTAALVANRLAGIGILVINVVVCPLILIYTLFRRTAEPFSDVSVILLGLLYVAMPFALFNFFFNPLMAPGGFHYELVLGFFAVMWINDTAAYLVGMGVGKHPLFERISPKKTWEGSIGGLIFGIITAWVLSRFFVQLTLLQWIIYAVIIMVTGTLGDLVESMLKRSHQLKDSGKILPGHGGILDRFDGVLVAVPFTFLYLLYVFGV
jgi:phosphatidate cytidylyltransferase